MTVGTMTTRATVPPYVGTRPFATRDAPRFFGRGREAEELAGLWRRNRVTVLYGPAGAGRTSLIAAGVLPLVGAPGDEAPPIGRVSHRTVFPVAALPDHNPYTLALLCSLAPHEPVTNLVGWSLRDFLRRRPRRTDSWGRRPPLLVAVDQVEELFADVSHAPGRDRRRRAFAEELAEALDEHDDLRLLLSIREGHLDELAAYERTLGGFARFRLAPLDPEAALEAVRRPLEATARSYAPGVAEGIVEDLAAGTDRVEPALLQVACAGLWRALPPDLRVITADAVRAHADVGASLAGFAGRVLGEVAERTGTSFLDLAVWLHALLDGHAATGDTAVPGPVLRMLEDRHLLGRAPGRDGYAVRHPRLIPALRAVTPTAPEPADTGTYLRDALHAMARGELSLAERLADAALRVTPGDELRARAEAETLLGNIAVERGITEDAESRYHAAAALLEACGDTAGVGRLLAAAGRLRLARGDGVQALEELRAAAERLPGDLTVRTELARVLWQLGQPQGAVTMVNSVLSAKGNVPEALRARGEFLADLGDAEGALRDLAQVRRRLPAITRAAHALALARVGRFEPARREIDEALTEAPNSGPVLLYAAQVEALRGEPDAADALARRAEAASEPRLYPHQRGKARLLLSGDRNRPR
jgi:tetratricopeptide (TPR) repeat protein